MIRSLDSLAIWLGDYYLLSTVLLAITLMVGLALRQPARRLAIIKATLVALGILAALCALPRYSVVHLRSAEPATATNECVGSIAGTLPPFSAAVELPSEVFDVRANKAAGSAKPTSDLATMSAAQKESSWQQMLATAYAVGAVGVFVWLVVGQLAAVRLRRQGQPANTELMTVLKQVATRAGQAVTPELLISDHVAAPVALGLLRPAILLPTGFAESRSEFSNPKSAIGSMLAHELAHIRNRDLAWLAVSRVLFVLLWAQPLFWLVRRWMRFDQETLADAAAAALTSREHYAEQLVAWARRLAMRPLPMRHSPAVGLWEGASQFRQRVAMLVNANFTVMRECSPHWRISSSVAVIAIGLMLATATVQPAKFASAQTAVTGSETPTKPESNVAATKEPAARKLSVPNRVIGQAVDEKDRPIAGAMVYLFRIRQSDADRTMISQTTTDAEGRFRLDNVIDVDKEFPDKKFPPLGQLGDVILQGFVQSPGRVAYSWFDSPQVLAQRGHTVRAGLPPAATLRGQVTGPDGRPVSGALVSIGNGASLGQWEGAKSARTDADGKYTINDAAPFDAAKYRKEREESQRQAKEHPDSYQLYLQQPILTVEHPGFASKQIGSEQIPGTMNVQLDEAAVLEGHVVLNDPGKPAGSVRVHAVTSLEITALPRQTSDIPLVYRASTLTDADGRYRIATLPAGKYYIWADASGWVNAGVDGVVITSGKRTEVPDLVLQKGGFVSVRLVDAQSSQPIRLEPHSRAMVVVQAERSLPQRRPNNNGYIDANARGRFNLHTWPGRKQIFVMGVFGDDEKIAWRGQQPIQATVVDQQTVEFDVPVISTAKDIAITGTYQGNSLAVFKLPGKDMIKPLTARLESQPDDVEALTSRAVAFNEIGDARASIADFEHAVKLDLPLRLKVLTYNNLAMLLATSADANLRDGKRAIELAEKAKQLASNTTPDLLDTLAAAYAEAGDFDRAIRTQKEAIDLAENSDRREQFREPLKLYEAHKPRRVNQPVSEGSSRKQGKK